MSDAPQSFTARGLLRVNASSHIERIGDRVGISDSTYKWYDGRIGERVATPGVTVVDDGAMHERRGSLTIDDEGTPTGRTVLIEDGILKDYLQEVYRARGVLTTPSPSSRARCDDPG
jgi:predicted Zn-dependent protease